MTQQNTPQEIVDTQYAALISTHEGLSTDESHALNARLVLMLMHALDDADRFQTLLKEARQAAE